MYILANNSSARSSWFNRNLNNMGAPALRSLQIRAREGRQFGDAQEAAVRDYIVSAVEEELFHLFRIAALPGAPATFQAGIDIAHMPPPNAFGAGLIAQTIEDDITALSSVRIRSIINNNILLIEIYQTNNHESVSVFRPFLCSSPLPATFLPEVERMEVEGSITCETFRCRQGELVNYLRGTTPFPRARPAPVWTYPIPHALTRGNINE